MPRKKASKKTLLDSTTSYLDKIEAEVQSNQSRVSYVLGILIVIFAGILFFNYFNNKSELGPSRNTQQATDVTPENLPGNYTVKEADTLFTIAEKYYHDGYQYPEIARANNLINVDSIQPGQVLTIPKLQAASATPTATSEISPSPTPSASPQAMAEKPADTQWGPAISADTYIVADGDWLSKIAARAYGDMMDYNKIAQANNIANPDLIEPGMVLTIPR